MKKQHPAKIWLGRYSALKARIVALEMECEKMRLELTRATARLDAVGSRSGGSKDALGERVVALVDREKMLAEEEKRLREQLEEILNVIRMLPDEEERMVITQRYVSGMQWDYILAHWPFHGRSTVFRVHGRALNHVAEILKLGPVGTNIVL